MEASKCRRRRFSAATADAAFAENLVAARAYYYYAHRPAPCPRPASHRSGQADGAMTTNSRRPGKLGKDPERAARRAHTMLSSSSSSARVLNMVPVCPSPVGQPPAQWGGAFLAFGVDDLELDPPRDHHRISGGREAEQQPRLLLTILRLRTDALRRIHDRLVRLLRGSEQLHGTLILRPNPLYLPLCVWAGVCGLPAAPSSAAAGVPLM